MADVLARAGEKSRPSMQMWLVVVARILLAVVGGYFASAGCLAAFCALLPLSGFPRSEAVVLGMMLAFILYLGLLLWCFAASYLWKPAAALALLTAGGFGIAALIGPGN